MTIIEGETMTVSDDFTTDFMGVADDDAALNTIAAGGQPPGELERLLVDWRAQIHAQPIPDLVDVTTAHAVICAAREQEGSAPYGLLAAAWALALIITVVTIWVGAFPL
jgi:hypothetical protein